MSPTLRGSAAFVALLVSLSAVEANAADPTPVTTCTAYTGEAMLVADLDCSAENSTGLAGNGHSTLHLNGFTLTGHPSNPVLHADYGRVEGPGTITGGSIGIDGAVITVNGATITSNGVGIRAHNVALTGATISNQTGIGVDAITIRVRESFIVDNGATGIRSQNYAGIVSKKKSKVTLADSTVSGNGYDGVTSDRLLRVRGSTIEDNGGAGLRSILWGPQVKESTVSQNWLAGLRGERAGAVDSTIIDNSTAPECASNAECADIATVEQPRVVRTTCGTSSNVQDGSTWGVCGAD